MESATAVELGAASRRWRSDGYLAAGKNKTGRMTCHKSPISRERTNPLSIHYKNAPRVSLSRKEGAHAHEARLRSKQGLSYYRRSYYRRSCVPRASS